MVSVRELLPSAGSQISEDCIFLSLIRLFCEFTLIQSALSTPSVRSFNLTKFLQQCVIYLRLATQALLLTTGYNVSFVP